MVWVTLLFVILYEVHFGQTQEGGLFQVLGCVTIQQD